MLLVSSALAHQPHDPIDLLGCSGGFPSDGVVLTSRYPNQNWRSLQIVRSTDGARTWSQAIVGLDNEADLTGLDLSPAFADDGVAFVTTEGDGGFVTVDGGASWSRVLPGEELHEAAVAHDGVGPVLLAVSHAELLRSTDLGATWTAVPVPPTTEPILRAQGATVAIAIGPVVSRSDDAGATFAAEPPLPGGVLDLSVSPGFVAVGNRDGVWLAAAGQPFAQLPATAGGWYDAVGLSPTFATDQVLMAAMRFIGVYVSSDGGARFSLHRPPVALSPQSTEHFFRFEFSGTFDQDHTVFLATFEGLLWSDDRGVTWHESDTRTPGLINGMALSPDFDTDGQVIVASYDGGVWVSGDGGHHLDVQNTGLPLGSLYDVSMARDGAGGVTAALAARDWSAWSLDPFDLWDGRSLPPAINYTSRIAFSPDYATDGTVLAGGRTAGLWRSTDDGGTWTLVSPAREAVSAIAWSGATVLAGTKAGQVLVSDDGGLSFAVAPNPPFPYEPVWIAHDGAGFVVGTGSGAWSTPDGRTWTPESSLPAAVVHQVGAAPDGTRFVALRGGGLYRSDAGSPYVQVGTDLTAIGSPHELELSPAFATDCTMFASIDTGLFRSVDRGDTWTRVGMARVRYEEDVQPVEPHLQLVASLSRVAGASTQGVALLRPGRSASLTFRGVGVSVLGATHPRLGEADVYVDGVFVAHLDQSGPFALQVEQFTTALPSGLHEIELRATSGIVAFDAFDVDVDLAAAP